MEKNFHQLHQESLQAKRLAGEESDVFAKSVILTEAERLREEHRGFKVAEHGGLRESIERLKRDKEKYELEQNTEIDIEAILETFDEESKSFLDIKDQINRLGIAHKKQFEFSRKLKQDPKNELLKSLQSAFNEGRKDAEVSINKTQKQDFDLVRSATILDYREEMHKDGHIAITPTVQENLEFIGEKMIEGRPVFLFGPTGTGKTSLAEYAALQFTGKSAEMVYCSEQTRESDIHGRTGIKTENGEINTEFIDGPLAKAMREGKVIIFDEFTSLDKNQMSSIKGLLKKQPGDIANIKGNGQIKISPGFQFIFTANLKSEKNPERTALATEMANEFGQGNKEIKYNSADEVYDTSIAQLFNEKGITNISRYDLDVTLPQLCRAFADIQKAYNNTLTPDEAKLFQAQDVGGKIQGLKGLVLNQRTMSSIINAWKINQMLDKDGSFAEFVDERLKSEVSFKEHIPADRILTAKILRQYGFFSTMEPKITKIDGKDIVLSVEDQLGLPNNTLQGLAGLDREETINQSQNVEEFTLLDLAKFDPFKLRQMEAVGNAKKFSNFKTNNNQEQENFETISTKEQFEELINAVNPKDYLNTDIIDNIDKILPLTIEKDTSKYDYINFGTERFNTTEKVQEEMEKQGYRPANAVELLYFIKQEEEKQNLTDRDYVLPDGTTMNKWYWVCSDDSSVLAGRVLGWARGGGWRRLLLDDRAGGWDGRGFFLAVRK